MKQIRLYSGLLLSLSLVFASCSSSSDDSGNPGDGGDDNLPTGITPPTAQAFNNLREAALDDYTQTFNSTLGFNTPVEFTSENGTYFILPAFLLADQADNQFTGDVEVEFVELYDRADMLITGFDTMGKNESGSLEMLTSGGAFFVKMYKKDNGEPLKIKTGAGGQLTSGYRLEVPQALTGGLKEDMGLWFGQYEDGSLIWEKPEDAGSINTTVDQYWMQGVKQEHFGWSSVSKIYDTSNNKTTFKANVPTGYNAENSAVYLSFEGENSALARLSVFENKTFSQPLIPKEKNCQVIFVSEFEGKWVYAIKSATITEGGSVTFETSDLKTATQAELVAKINELP